MARERGAGLEGLLRDQAGVVSRRQALERGPAEPGRRGHDSGPIHVAVSAERRVAPVHGVEVHRVTGLADRALWHTSPPRIRIEEAVLDLAAEHAYLTRVERPHGLPRPRRQAVPPGQRVLRDVDYEASGLVVELDGRLFHSSAGARDADLERDLDARLLDDRVTCGSAGDRSTTGPAEPRPSSACSCSSEGGPAAPPAAPTAERETTRKVPDSR